MLLKPGITPRPMVVPFEGKAFPLGAVFLTPKAAAIPMVTLVAMAERHALGQCACGNPVCNVRNLIHVSSGGAICTGQNSRQGQEVDPFTDVCWFWTHPDRKGTVVARADEVNWQSSEDALNRELGCPLQVCGLEFGG